MSRISKGSWGIESVVVGSETVMNYDGFEELRVANGQISINPIGLDFKIEEATKQSLILDSQGEIYFADFQESGDSLELQLTRPQFPETIVVNARAAEVCSRVTDEREVVQV